jgi:hypothetical protein
MIKIRPDCLERIERPEDRQGSYHKWCFNKMYRERRKAQGAAGRHQRNAHMYVWLAVYFGDLVKPDECEHCDAVTTDLHGHHETYDLPLEVEWVCRSCNAKLGSIPL